MEKSSSIPYHALVQRKRKTKKVFTDFGWAPEPKNSTILVQIMASLSQLLLPNPVGGAVFIFGAKISIKSPKNMLFCILFRPIGGLEPPLATLLATCKLSNKSKMVQLIFCVGIIFSLYQKVKHFCHLILDPVLTWSMVLAGFCMVIVFAMPCHFARSHASSLTSPFFFISFSTCFFHVCFGLPMLPRT